MLVLNERLVILFFPAPYSPGVTSGSIQFLKPVFRAKTPGLDVCLVLFRRELLLVSWIGKFHPHGSMKRSAGVRRHWGSAKLKRSSQRNFF